MNRFIRAWHALRGKDTQSQRNYSPAVWQGLGLSGYGVNAQRDLSYTTLGASLAYQFVPPVKSCIDVIAENGASAPLVVTDGDGNEVARSDENPQDSDMLMALEKSWEYHKMSVIDLWIRSHLLWGMTFLEKAENRSGYVKNLHWLNTNSVMIDAPQGIITGYRYYGLDRQVIYTPDEMLYARTFNPGDDVHGFSKTLNILGKANAQLHFEKFRGSYFNNGGQPGFAFIPEADASEDQLKLLANFWKQELRGVENFFKTLMSPLPGKLEQFDPVDLSKSQGTEDTLYDQIRQGFRVPAELIGDSKNNSYQFSDETKNTFMVQTVAPIMSTITEALNRELYPAIDPAAYERGYRIMADFSAYSTVSEADLKAQQLAENKFKSGGITHHAYIRELGGEPEQGSQDFWVFPTSVQLIPVGELGQAVTPATQNEPPALPAPRRDAPANVEFSSVTYNGVTVQASPVRPSSRDDKKYMRYVRHNGDERLVHWGQPGEQMERDNDEARENFNARHNCSEKKDPFAAGFWACWAWQPNADVRAMTLDDLRSVAHKFDIPLSQALDYLEEFERVH